MGGFVRCYATECIYNSENKKDETSWSSAFNSSYGVCMRNKEGDKITLNRDRMCISHET